MDAGRDVGVDVFAGLGGEPEPDASAAPPWAVAGVSATPECIVLCAPPSFSLIVERPLPLSMLDADVDAVVGPAVSGGVGEGCSRNVRRALPTTAGDSRSTFRRCLATMRAVESIIGFVV